MTAPPREPTADEVFTDLYRRHHRDLYRSIARRVGNHATAEDLAADVWVKAYKAIAAGTWTPDNPLAWLYLSARCRVIDHWRCGFHARETPTDTTATLADQPATETDGTEDTALARVQAQAVTAAVQRLPHEQQRETVRMHYYAGLSGAQIGRRLGITAASARDRIDRATTSVGRDPALRCAMGLPPVDRRRDGRGWTDAGQLRTHYPAVAALTAAGMAAGVIGDRLGLSAEQVRGIRKRLRREAATETFVDQPERKAA